MGNNVKASLDFENLISGSKNINLLTASTTKQLETLSSAERKVLKELKLGLTNVEISKKLSLQDKTIKFHLTSIFKKLSVRNRLQLIVKVLKHDFTLYGVVK